MAGRPAEEMVDWGLSGDQTVGGNTSPRLGEGQVAFQVIGCTDQGIAILLLPVLINTPIARVKSGYGRCPVTRLPGI